MKFKLKCDDMDGLVFIDKSNLAELNNDMLYALDILLDPFGKTELVFDFPNETWEIVRPRETKRIKEFCEHLHIPTGKLLAVTAGEMIQCLSYPELEMEKIFELEVEDGWYAIWDKGIDEIMYCKKDSPSSITSNIQEMYGK